MPDQDILTSFLWFALALGIGAWSERKGGSFIAGVFASILLTPFIAGLVLAIRRPLKK